MSYYYNVIYLDAHQLDSQIDGKTGQPNTDLIGHGRTGAQGIQVRPDQEESRFTCVIKSHNHPTKLIEKYPHFFNQENIPDKPILIYREPKDAAVSYYFYQYFHLPLILGYRPGKFSVFLRLLVRKFLYFRHFVLKVAAEWREFHAMWMESPHFPIKYEDMILDVHGTMHELILKLDGKVNEKYLAEAIECCQFQNLKRHEDERTRPHSRHESFFREGKTEGWKKHFSPQLAKDFNDLLGPVYGKYHFGGDSKEVSADVVISIENLSKEYRLGVIGTGMLFRDLQSWFARLRGLPDPNVRVSNSLASVHENKHENRRFWALKNINLEVRRGEVIGIVGRNGAGKSTLLKILSQVTTPTLGRIRIKGRVVSLLEVGTGFHPELTGRENIFLNGAILGMTQKEIRAKLPEIVEFAEIESFVDTPVKRYSSGMYMRLAFAVAAHLDPDILVVDEVLAVGDIRFQNKCLGKMKDVSSRDGRTVLFVSHNMGSIYTLCTRVIWIDKKRVAEQGAPEVVVPKYLEDNSLSQAKSEFKRIAHNGYTLHSLTVLNDGQKTSFLNAGSCVEFILEFDSPQYIKVASVVFRFSTTISDAHLMLCSDPDYGYCAPFYEGSNRVHLRIPKIHLPAGNYKVSIQLNIPQVETLARFDSVHEVEVASGDFYKNGFSIWMNRSAYIEECEWKIDRVTTIV